MNINLLNMISSTEKTENKGVKGADIKGLEGVFGSLFDSGISANSDVDKKTEESFMEFITSLLALIKQNNSDSSIPIKENSSLDMSSCNTDLDKETKVNIGTSDVTFQSESNMADIKEKDTSSEKDSSVLNIKNSTQSIASELMNMLTQINDSNGNMSPIKMNNIELNLGNGATPGVDNKKGKAINSGLLDFLQKSANSLENHYFKKDSEDINESGALLNPKKDGKEVDIDKIFKGLTELLNKKKDIGEKQSNFNTTSVDFYNIAKNTQLDNGSVENSFVKNVSTEISKIIENRVQSGNTEKVDKINVNLRPDKLGRLEIEITHLKDKIEINFKTESALTKEILQSSLGFLKDTLDSKNINIEKFNFDLINQNGGSGRNFEGNQSSNQNSSNTGNLYRNSSYESKEDLVSLDGEKLSFIQNNREHDSII